MIGRNNALPWHLPGDLRHFRATTMGKTIIMGRRTWESIGRPLPGRTKIVISRRPDYVAEGARVVDSLDAALSLAQDITLIDGAEEAVVIGGAEIYRAAWARADRIYFTEVHAEVDGDAYLPEPDWEQWQEVSRERFEAESPNPYAYSGVTYERRRN